jgi:outer membrane protein OmpA-like peptidoglycan-associated protein
MIDTGLAASIKNRQWGRWRRPLKLLAWVVGIFLALAAAAWLALPSFVKKTAIEQTREKIGRKLEIGEVAFNPFRLALTASGITLYEADGKTPFFSAKSLLVNASSSSLFRLAPVLDEIKLAAPEVHVVRLDAEGIGHYNFSDILDRIDALPKSDSKSLFSLANVQLQDGRIRFEDKVTGKNIDIAALQIGLPFLSNLPGNVDSFVQPQLSASINGTPFRLQGRSKPFASTQESAFAIDIDKLDVVSYLPFVPAQLPVALQSATLSTRLDLSFVRADGKPRVALAGDIALDDVAVQDKSQGQLFKAKKLAASIKQFDVLDASGEIQQVTVEGPQVWASMNARGEINWLRALASGKSAKNGKATVAANTAAAPTPAADQKDAAIVIRQLAVRDGEINWRDEANAAPAQSVKLAQLDIEAAGLSTAADAKPATLKLSAVENGHGKLAFDGALAPLKAQLDGKATLEGIDIAGYQNYLNRALAAKVSGKLSGSAAVRFQDGQLKVSDAGAELADLKLAPKAKGAGTISVKSIALQKASLDLAAHQAQADSLRIGGLVGEIRRERDGNFSVQQWQAETPAAGGEAAPAQPAPTHAKGKAAPSPWVARLNSFSLDDGAIAFEDAAGGANSKLRVHGIKLQVQNLSTKLDQASKLSLQALFDKSGKLDINGQVAPQLKSIDLDLSAKALPVVPFQGYFSNLLNVTFSSGLLDVRGKLALTPPLERQKFALSYNGSAAVNNLRMQDKLTSTDFLRWRALELSGIRARLGGRPQISLDKVALNSFYARAILSEQGRLNLQDILVADAQSQGSITDDSKKNDKDKPSGASRKTSTSSAPVTSAAPDPNAPIVRVGQVELKAGNINYTDNFVKPNYTANMTGLAGTIGEISSDKPQPAAVNISGKIDNDAPLQISGSLNPLFKPMFLDIKASANGVQLPRLTPYSAKYAGYPITKGKLSMDVQYKIENDKLVAQNDLRIEQLTFGERVDSPDATKLPVMLAVSLLKDRDGNINLNLPISGSLSDPEFSMGGIIVRVFVNLIVKAVTSPFALIGSMFHSSDNIGELRYIAFPPGSSEITPEVRKKLDALGYVLNERPGIKLDITGRVDPKVDDQGLRLEALNRQMRALKRRDLIEKEGQPSGPVQISDAERPGYLERVYKDAKFQKPRNVIGFAKSLPPEQMQKLIVDNTQVTDDDLRKLAQARADQVRNYLQEQSVIPPERIFLIAPKLSSEGIPDKEPAARVDLNIQ